MMQPVRTSVSYQAADGDYEAPREQRAAPDLHTNSIFAAYFLLVARKYARVIYCHHFMLLVMWSAEQDHIND